MDLALNNLQMLICHKTQTTDQPTLMTSLKFEVGYSDVAILHVNQYASRISPSIFWLIGFNILLHQGNSPWILLVKTPSTVDMTASY